METETKCVNCGCSTPVDVAAVREDSFRQGLLAAANSCDRWADDLSGLVDSVEHHLRSKAKAIRALSAEPALGERLTGRISGRAALAQGGGE